MKNKQLFESLKVKLFRSFLIAFSILYIVTLILAISSAIWFKNRLYTITCIVIMFLLTIIPVVYMYYLKLLLDPLAKINDYIKMLSTFRYYKKKEYTNVEDYRILLDNISLLSNLLEETKLNYEQYKNRINDLNSKREIIELQERDLIYSISHELKTPLSIIEAGACAILDGIYEGEEATNELNEIVNECKISVSMIQDVLNVFKLERSDFKLDNELFNLTDLVNEKLKSFDELFKKYKTNLILNFSPAFIYADKKQIGTVLSNVINNAITNSPIGSDILINVSQKGNEAIFDITNSNSSIPEEKIDHIFEPFIKIDESHTKKEHKGNGLGLYIVKQILNKFNYDFGIMNVKNGVKFFFVGSKK